jgi:hypothetical protein
MTGLKIVRHKPFRRSSIGQHQLLVDDWPPFGRPGSIQAVRK